MTWIRLFFELVVIVMLIGLGVPKEGWIWAIMACIWSAAVGIHIAKIVIDRTIYG